MNALQRLAVSTLGVVFLASAILKSLDVTTLAAQVSYLGVTREPWAAYLASVGLIGGEALLGGALLLGLGLRRLTLPIAGGLLVLFTGVIGWAWVFRDIQDCGCFGKYVPMTPPEAILKNLALLGLTVYAWRDLGRLGRRGWGRLDARFVLRVGLAALGAIAAAGMAMVQAPPPASGAGVSQVQRTAGASASSGEGPFSGYSLTRNGKTTYDLTRGTYLVALLSESCDHCAEEVARLNRLIADPQLPPVVGLVLGDDEAIQTFVARYQPAFPTRAMGVLEFLNLIGEAPPRYILERDGLQLTWWDGQAPTHEELHFALQQAATPESR